MRVARARALLDVAQKRRRRNERSALDSWDNAPHPKAECVQRRVRKK